MSKINCVCHHVIRDQSDAVPYKAVLLLDIDQDELTSWMVAELQTYVEAAKSGNTDAWLTNRGCDSGYLNLELDHGTILFDQVLSRYRKYEKTVYECTSCGRLLLEGEENQFLPYSPDSGMRNGVLSMTRKKRP